MNLSQLPKITKRPAKRVGRGVGSGKGSHTTGRGQKGQKARGDVPIQFEGTKTKKSFIKRLPMLRGKGKFKAWGVKYTIVKLSDLESWSSKMPVTEENLLKQGIISSTNPVKILADGEVKSALDVRVKCSKEAVKKIEKLGGKIA